MEAIASLTPEGIPTPTKEEHQQLRADMLDDVCLFLSKLLGAVGGVLLIACVNLTNLLAGAVH